MCQSPSELDAKLPPHTDTKKHVTMTAFAIKPTVFLRFVLFFFFFFFLIVPKFAIKSVGKYSQTELQIGRYNDVKTEGEIILIYIWGKKTKIEIIELNNIIKFNNYTIR